MSSSAELGSGRLGGRRLVRSATRRVLAVAATVVFLLSLATGMGAVRADAASHAASQETLALVTDSARLRVDTYVGVAWTIARSAAFAIGTGNLDVETELLPAILYRHLLRAPQLTGIHVVTPDGVSVEIWSTDGGFESRVVKPGQGGFDVTRAHADTFAMLGEAPTVGGDDPRESAPYVSAIEGPSPSWSEPQVQVRGGEPVATVGDVARSSSHAVVAVVWVDLGLDGLQQELAAVPLGDDGTVAVVAPSGEVVVRRDAGALGSASELAVDSPLGPAERSRLVADRANLLAQEVPLGTPGGPGWIVHVQASPTTLAPGLQEMVIALRLLTLASFVVVVGGSVIGWRLTRPLNELTRSATTDPMTGLANRREAMRMGPLMIAHTREDGLVSCVVACDLDNFKAINDTRGHADGDAALVAVAAALRAGVREGDLVCRWGGDEFVVVLTLPASADARRVVDTLREGAEAELKRVVGPGLAVGVTAGFSESSPLGEEFAALIEAADAALVEGKAVRKSRTYPLESRELERSSGFRE